MGKYEWIPQDQNYSPTQRWDRPGYDSLGLASTQDNRSLGNASRCRDRLISGRLCHIISDPVQPFAISSDRFRKHVDDPFAANLQVVKVRVLVVILANTVKDGRVDICRHLYGSRLTSYDLTLSDSHKLSALEHFLVLFKRLRHQTSALE